MIKRYVPIFISKMTPFYTVTPRFMCSCTLFSVSGETQVIAAVSEESAAAQEVSISTEEQTAGISDSVQRLSTQLGYGMKSLTSLSLSPQSM